MTLLTKNKVNRYKKIVGLNTKNRIKPRIDNHVQDLSNSSTRKNKAATNWSHPWSHPNPNTNSTSSYQFTSSSPQNYPVPSRPTWATTTASTSISSKAPNSVRNRNSPKVSTKPKTILINLTLGRWKVIYKPIAKSMVLMPILLKRTYNTVSRFNSWIIRFPTWWTKLASLTKDPSSTVTAKLYAQIKKRPINHYLTSPTPKKPCLSVSNTCPKTKKKNKSKSKNKIKQNEK